MDDISAGSVTHDHDRSPLTTELLPATDASAARSPPPAPRTRIDREAEVEALACVRRGEKAKALQILMTAYGAPLTAFVLRTVRNRELAEDVRQQVFLEAFQGLEGFEGRSSLWTWLTSIAHHRCLDSLKQSRRMGVADDFDVLETLLWQPDPAMDVDVVAKRRALERCLSKLPAALRAEVLMRYDLGLSYVEIGQSEEVAPGTIQVRLSRILPKLRRCLRGEGVAR